LTASCSNIFYNFTPGLQSKHSCSLIFTHSTGVAEITTLFPALNGKAYQKLQYIERKRYYFPEVRFGSNDLECVNMMGLEKAASVLP
jgi:hypothetical protein